MFQTKFVEKIKKHFALYNFFFFNIMPFVR